MQIKLLVVSMMIFASEDCSNKSGPPLFQLQNDCGINFNNKVVDGELENSFYFRNYYNGGGVAIGDINNDGLPDVFLTSNMEENKLYLNKGNLQFTDISSHTGMKQDSMWSTGAVMVDINHDGWLDIYVCNSGHMQNGNRRNKLYINNHDLSFTESAKFYGLDISAYSTQVSFFDYDMDGDLDCFMINNSPIPVNIIDNSNRRDLPDSAWNVSQFFKGGGDHLFRNDGGHFVEVTGAAGIHGSLISFGLGVCVGDINGDGYPDVYVSNDSYERDYLYVNQKNGTFRDEFESYFQHTSLSSMGADMADVNNDGYPDIFTTDMLPEDDHRLKILGAYDNIDLFRTKEKQGFYHQYMKNCLQINNRNGTFTDMANYGGVAATDWSWGELMFDADNDGYTDIYVCNGVNKDVTNLDFMDFFANDVVQNMVKTGQKQSVDEVLKNIPVHPMLNKAFRNLGNLRFADEGVNWGFTQPSFSNGAAYADMDNDGDLDLVINNENEKAFVYRNNSREINGNNYIGISLRGKGANSMAIGARISVFANQQVYSRDLIPSRGFQSSVDYKQIIGIGKVTAVDSIVVIWPDRSCSRFAKPGINQVHDYRQPDHGDPFPNMESPTTVMFDSVKLPFERHIEDDFVDFYYERNIPEMLSREGPHATQADVNGDGLPDLYIGGAAGQAGQLYLRTAKGTFVKKEEKVFNDFAAFEDVAVLFFDADKDGDMDLFIGAGGNRVQGGSRELEHRLYKNDGRGNFSIDVTAFPANGENIAVAAANDFDGDGDLDLFVGGRSVPGNYGLTPQSYIYRNDGTGHFTDITSAMNPDIMRVGMVTGALWTDLTGDSKKELVITGEWMAPRIFSFNGTIFNEVKTNLGGLHGWWKTIGTADVNNDGKADLLLGNIGDNFPLVANSTRPLKMWISDFDMNGTPDVILTKTIAGRDMPVFLKRDLQDQIPSIKKQNLRHEQYAGKSVQDLFPPEAIVKSVVKQIDFTTSCVAINKGNGQFEVRKLPAKLQCSSVNSLLIVDINHDQYPDMILGGNDRNFLPQFEQLDGDFGDVLINDKKGNFTIIDSRKSGLKVDGVVTQILDIGQDSQPVILFLRNNLEPQVMIKSNKMGANINY